VEHNQIFTKLKTRMMKWAEEKKYQTSKNGDFTIPDHPNRSKSWKDELTFVNRFESQSKDLTRLQKIYLNQLWRAYKI